jgi:PAS domain S-box-containing protein
MPAYLIAGVPNLKIGTGVGSCGTAAFEKRDVISEDIALDPLWETWRDLVSPMGFRACWSKPVFSSTGDVIASFGFYFRERRSPTPVELQDLTRLRGLAATAIERAGMLDALRESEAHYRFTVEQSPQIPWTADPKGMVLGVSSRWTEMTGLSRTESLGNGWLRALHPADVMPTTERWDEALSTGAPLDFNYRVGTASGGYRWIRARAMPRRNESGKIVRWYGSLEDIHEQYLASEKLKRHAYEDDLTRLPNRRSFVEELRNGLQRGSESIGLLVLDMDDFKLVNDRFGHQVGDAVLRLFGRYLQRIADPSEFVARLGGDEFAIICRSVTREDDLLRRANVIAERL